MFGTTFKTLHIFPLYKLFGYKFPLKICPCNSWVTIHVVWCFCSFFFVFVSFLLKDYLTLDLSHLSLAGQQRQHVWNVVETDATPPRSLIPRSLADGRSAELFMICFFLHPLWFFQKSGGGIFQETAPNAWWCKWRMYEKTMQKNKHKGNWCCTRFLIRLNFLMIRQTRPTKLPGRS